MEEVINQTIKAKPDEPFSFMVRALAPPWSARAAAPLLIYYSWIGSCTDSGFGEQLGCPATAENRGRKWRGVRAWRWR